MGRGTSAYNRTGKFSRVKQWDILVCPKCGYTVEFCQLTMHWHYCPLCLRNGKGKSLGISPPTREVLLERKSVEV